MIETVAGVLATALVALLAWMAKKIGEIDKSQAVQQAQYENNGGKTLRDAVDRIENKIDENVKKLADHLIESATQTAKFDAHIAGHTTVVVQPAPAPPAP